MVVELPKPADLGTTVSYHIRFGGGVKVDKNASKELRKDKGVKGKKRAKVVVDIFDSPYLDHAKKIGAGLRTFVYKNTLPWGDDGRRFLPNATKLKFDAEVSQRVVMIREVMEKHFKDLPRLKKRWENEGGDLAKDENNIIWPTEAEARLKFSIDIDPGTIEDMDDVRVGALPKEHQERFIADVRAAEERRMNKTVQDVSARVVEVLERVVDRTKQYGKDKDGKVVGSFTNTLISNVRELAGLLEHFNITGDPEIEDVRRRMVNDICHINPEDLKESESLRKETGEKAQDILERVGMFGRKRD